jgi:PhoH-like ATPase
MADKFTGVKVLEDQDPALVTELYKNKKIDIESLPNSNSFYPNLFIVIKSASQASALTRVSPDGRTLLLLQDIEASGIKPKNKEQTMALNMLMDDSVPLNVLIGRAGTGKTLLTLAVAMQKFEEKKYERLILTKPMSQVGKRDLGALPGDVNEKFAPYLMNYMSNFEQLVGRKSTQDAISQFHIEFIPMQLIRGASFLNAFVIADEVQVLDHHEMLTLGTRIGENSKLVVMGDLNQRDEKIAKNKTGLWKIMEDEKMKSSGLVAAIELIKVERSPLAKLFADVFEE